MTNTDILRLIEKHSLIGGEIFNQLNTIQLNKDLLLLLEQCNFKRRFSLEEFIWSKAFPTEPYNADDYYDWSRENATYALNLAYEYCSENGV